MRKRKRRSKRRLVLLPDPDKLGLVVATFCATLAMGFSFLREVDGFVVAYRTALTFTLAYCAVFLFVRLPVYHAMNELNAQKEEKLAQRRAEAKKAAKELGGNLTDMQAILEQAEKEQEESGSTQ